MNDPLLSSKDVMARFGFSSPTNFWAFVRRERIPCVRLSRHLIRFESGPLEDWLEKRRSVKSKTTPALLQRAAALGNVDQSL